MPHTDLATASAAALVELFPDLGLFTAEDIVDWREKNGAFPDEQTLVATLGLDAALAARVSAATGADAETPEADSPTTDLSEAPDLQEILVPDAPRTRSSKPTAPPTQIEEPPQAVVADVPAVEEPLVAPAPSAEAPPPPVSAVSQSAIPASPAAGASDAPRPTAGGTSRPKRSSGPPKRRRFYPVIFSVIIATNLGLAAGLFQTRREAKREIAPIASMSAKVEDLHAGQAEIRTELAETRSQLAETRARVDKHDGEIAGAREAVDKAAQRQKDAERAAQERDAREARERAALSGRVSHVERRANEVTYSLAEAMKVLDSLQGQAGRPPEPPPKAEPNKEPDKEPKRGPPHGHGDAHH